MSEEILEHCNFTWYFNNTKLQVQTDDKYKTELKANHSKCRKEFSLTVTNVTFYDEGKYSCHQICYYGRSIANISLHVYQKQGERDRRLITFAFINFPCEIFSKFCFNIVKDSVSWENVFCEKNSILVSVAICSTRKMLHL